MTEHTLFRMGEFYAVLRARQQDMFSEINEVDADYLLTVSVDSVCEYFEQKYWVHVPQLKEDEITVEIQDAKAIRHDIFDHTPFEQIGSTATFFVPFEGSADLFNFRPSSFRLVATKAQIKAGEVVFDYFSPYSGRDSEEERAQYFRAQLDNDLDDVRFHLEAMSKDAEQFNETLRSIAREQIESRRKKLLQDKGISVALGFPLKPRMDAPQTYVVPTVRKKIPSLPPASKEPYMPEPVLDMKHYEHILSVIHNMVLVMERSPRAFQGMNEENLRDHFLVQLNGQYEGQATGETFNFEGKTDILIREQGRNIFVAECKFWKGSQAFIATIDQLLGYASWRDTKTAIVLFNRNKNFSAVLAKIPDTAKAHPNFRRELPAQSETQFRYIFMHKNDPNRELVLTVMAFEVPSET